MAIDVSHFNLCNVIDTCAVWNILSSQLLYSTSCQAGCYFCITYFVLYECLYKPRKNSNEHDARLKERLLRKESASSRTFQAYSLSIEDLQEVSILENAEI